MDKKPEGNKQPKNNKQPKDVVVMGEATALTKGYNFDYVIEIQTWDKRR